MNTRKNFVFRSLALSVELNERLIRAAKLDDRSVSAILRRGMLKEIARIEAEHEEILPPLPVKGQLVPNPIDPKGEPWVIPEVE